MMVARSGWDAGHGQASRRKPSWGRVVLAAAGAALLLHAAVWWCWQAGHSAGWPVDAGHALASGPVRGKAMEIRWLPPKVAQPEFQPASSTAAVAQAPVPESATPSGREGVTVHYLPADALSDRPRPEPGWLLDEDALASVRQARLTMRLWVSAQGHIDRVALLSAEPPGDWAERALQRLPDTPMSPGWKDGRAVASTLVVEIASEIESFR